MRAPVGPIVVRRGANIQDGSVLHGEPVTDATVLDGVVSSAARALIAAGATVPPGMVVPDGMIAVGVRPGCGEVTGRAKEWVDTTRPSTASWPGGTRPAPGS